jgi:hypothetical protein
MKEKNMKKLLVFGLVLSTLLINAPAFAKTTKNAKCSKHQDTHGINGDVTLKSIGAGALSLIIWPGLGQLMNDGDNTDKVLTHALIGFFPLFRIWSCYDGVVDRSGGVWKDRI